MSVYSPELVQFETETPDQALVLHAAHLVTSHEVHFQNPPQFNAVLHFANDLLSFAKQQHEAIVHRQETQDMPLARRIVEIDREAVEADSQFRSFLTKLTQLEQEPVTERIQYFRQDGSEHNTELTPYVFTIGCVPLEVLRLKTVLGNDPISYSVSLKTSEEKKDEDDSEESA